MEEEKQFVITPEKLKKYGNSIIRPDDPPKEKEAVSSSDENPFKRFLDEFDKSPGGLKNFFEFLLKLSPPEKK
ncbi:MAG: hypothetical protein QM526_01310 [Alphaproteobacteria bacterium]|nr:hypothetical protein [Alphaproteobacteria bacterium]